MNSVIRYEISKDLNQFYTLNGKPICPLVIGITGHRDIAESTIEEVKKSVTNSLTSLCKKWNKLNKQKDIPILVLDGMAVGADQLVAEVVLQLKKKPETQCLKLISVLPMPWEDYQKYFEPNSELPKTEQLRQASDAEIVIELSENNRQIRAQNPMAEIQPSEQYQRLGEFMVQASFCVFALWDGKDWKKRNDVRPALGGTADVVRMAMLGNEMNIGYLTDENKQYVFDRNGWDTIQPYGYVFAIHTPRQKTSDTETIFAKEVRVNGKAETRNLPAGTTGLCRMNEVQDSKLSFYKNDDLVNKLAEMSFYPMSMTDCLKVRWFHRKQNIQECFENLATSNLDLSIKIEESKLQESQEYLFEDRQSSEQFSPQSGGNLSVLVQYYKYFDNLSQHFQTQFENMSFFYLFLLFMLGFCYYSFSLIDKNLIDKSSLVFPDVIKIPFEHVAEIVRECITTPVKWLNAILNTDVSLSYIETLPKFHIIIFAVHNLLLVSLIGIFLWYRWKKFYYERYHRYRAVAEALRVQIFWYMSNISECVMDHYHSYPISDLSWIRLTLNVIQIPMNIKNDKTEDHPGLNFIFTHWVKDQRNFFLKKIKEHTHNGNFYNGLTILCSILVLIWLFLRLFSPDSPDWNPQIKLIFSFIKIFFAMCGVTAFCSYTINRLRCYDSQARRYKKTSPIYMNFCNHIEDSLKKDDPNETFDKIEDKNIQRELFYFGRYALAENADWFLTKRKLELPK